MADAQSWRNLTTVADNREAALEIARLARRQLSIFTRDLEPQIYDTHEFVEAVKNLALSASRAQVRILLVEATRAAKEGHRLVELSRRLSSFIEIRRPHRDYLDMVEAFMIADEQGLVYRKLSSRWEGIVDPHDPMQARDRLKLFDQIWQRSHAEAETRQLRI